jgi:hypothetical protein
LRSKSVDGAQKGSAARNVTETKFIWKNRKLKRPYKRSFLIQMALHVSWTTLQEQIFAKLRRPYRSEANMNEVGHDQTNRVVYLNIDLAIEM